jgi:hypothetical protein
VQFDTWQGGQAFHVLPFNEAEALSSAVSATYRLIKRIQVSLQTTGQGFDGQTFPNPAVTDAATDRNWHAVYTIPQHEKSVAKHLEMREIESFLPVYVLPQQK